MILRLIPRAHRIRLASVAACGAALVLLPACTSPSASAHGRTTVVASFYPLAYAAERVGGPLVSVSNLTAPGVEPHDIELTPRQIGDISGADLVVYLGGGFQPAVQDAVANASGTTLDVSAGLRDRPVPNGEADPSLTADPHVWLDPVLYRAIVDRIERALATIDGKDRSTFASNAHALDAQLSAVDGDYRVGLSSCARNVIVTTHAAFGYLAARYGLVQDAISGLSPDAEPTPQRLAQLRSIVLRDGVTTIFTESLVSPKIADTLASETGATTAVLDPLESLTPAEMAAGDDYVSVMRSNLTELERALGCH
jgi:zinc transport system substrate-binding protein